MNFRMPEQFRKAYFHELEQYHLAMNQKDFSTAWRFLERAHVIGQYHPVSHTGIHFRMLVFALRRTDAREILGQILRLSVGWFGSLVNRIPVGNTGGVSVPILASLPIPEDLRGLLVAADTETKGLAGLRN